VDHQRGNEVFLEVLVLVIPPDEHGVGVEIVDDFTELTERLDHAQLVEFGVFLLVSPLCLGALRPVGERILSETTGLFRRKRVVPV
jgi:hypothetical protein